MSEAIDRLPLRLAYLHGFASSPLSRKGKHLEAFLARRGIPLDLPDLNAPDFAHLTYSGALGAIDRLDAKRRDELGAFRWGFVGSSMGGYLAARWAELHPDRVERLVLLCPGFHLADRWPVLFGRETFAHWERERWLPLPDARGVLTPVWWELVRDARTHPAAPTVPCPTHIVHGRRDEVVPAETSIAYARGLPHVELTIVDDTHELMDSLPVIEEVVSRFFDLDRAGGANPSGDDP